MTTTTKTYVPHLKVTPPPIENAVEYTKEVEGFGAPGFVPRRPLEQWLPADKPRVCQSTVADIMAAIVNHIVTQLRTLGGTRTLSAAPRNPEADLKTGEELISIMISR